MEWVSKYLNECEYGGLVEWYWQGKAAVLVEKLFQYHFVHNKLNMECLWIETGFPPWENFLLFVCVSDGKYMYMYAMWKRREQIKKRQQHITVEVLLFETA
jgi:hypothetical protein